MTTTKTAKGILPAAALAVAAGLASCSSEKKEPDCVPAPAADTAKTEKYEMTRLNIDAVGKKDNDWCRACVMGPKRYASCQRVYGDTPTEPRDAIRERARIKACLDSGFPAGICPANATIGITCKGDPPPPGAGNPGKALQDMFNQLNPAPKPGKAADQPADQPAKEPPKSILE
jgi:hypothetical protein